MAEKEKVPETAREARGTARETVGESAETAQRASETAARGYEDLLILSRDNLEGVTRASQAVLKGTSDLGIVLERAGNHRRGGNALAGGVPQLG